MSHKNIGYHTRLYADNTVKVAGGSFGGSIDMETVNRLVRMFTVVVKPSGTPVLVDQEGREVRLYLSVDVVDTEAGKAALIAWRAQREAQEHMRQEQQETEDAEIANLIGAIGYDEAVRRLRRGGGGAP